jgi:hypothetical protein
MKVPPGDSQKKWSRTSLIPSYTEHHRPKELDRIQQILGSFPTIAESVMQDPTHDLNPYNYKAQWRVKTKHRLSL